MSVTKTYNKLVRDKQLEIFDAAGHEYTYKILEPEEFLKELLDKLVEEAIELRDSPGDIEERADVQEVLDKIDRVFNWWGDEIRLVQSEKASRKGRFDRGLYLKEITKE